MIKHAYLLWRRPRFNLAAALVVAALAVGAGYTTQPSQAATSNVTVNFGTPLATTDSQAFSSTISTYGSGGGSISASSKQRAALGALGLGFYRVPLQWNGGNIITAAGGGPTNVSGDTWVANIRSFGGTPMVVVGGTSDNNFTPSDAANLVSHFSGANRVGYWVIGNEPGNGGMSISSYCTVFNQTADAMKAVDPTIKVAGPAWAYFDANTLQTFLTCAGSRVDIIDYHHYAMGSSYLDNATALSQTQNWEDEVNQTRQIINSTVPGRAAQISIQVGEYNWSWRTGDGYSGYNGDDRFYQPVATVWAASVAGHVVRAGGRGHQYSDQNGALGLTFETTADASHFGQTVGDPMPVYQGLRMFSGGSLFRGFGSSVVQATTTLSNVEVFASDNAKNVVLVNKSPSAAQAAVVQTTGVAAGTVAVWQTSSAAPFAAPVRQADAAISGSQLSVNLPAYSVTTLVITPAVATPTPVPTATPTPTPSSTPSSSPYAGPATTPTPSASAKPVATASPVPVSGTIKAPDTQTGKAVIKVDGVPVATGSLDTTYLTNGQHTVTVETTAPDGTKKSSDSVIQVNNRLTPWQTFRNNLFAPFRGNKHLMNTALIVIALLLVGGAGFLAYRRLWHQRPADWEVRSNID